MSGIFDSTDGDGLEQVGVVEVRVLRQHARREQLVMPREKMLMRGAPDHLVDLVADREPGQEQGEQGADGHAGEQSAYWFDAALPTMAPAKAPASSMPSISMFTTPDRSHRTPAGAEDQRRRPPEGAVEQADQRGGAAGGRPRQHGRHEQRHRDRQDDRGS